MLPRKRYRKITGFTFRVLVSIGTLFYLFSIVRVQKLKSLLLNVDLFFLLVGACLFLSGIFLSALKWKLIVERIIKVSYWDLLKLYFLGYYFKHFLPSNIGGDAIRGFYLGKKSKMSLGLSYGTVFLERVTGLFAVGGMLILGVVINFSKITKVPLSFFYGFSLLLVFLIGGTIFLSSKRGKEILAKLLFLNEDRLNEVLIRYKEDKRFWVQALLLSFLFQGIVIIAVYFFLFAVGVPVELKRLIFIEPVITLISFLPLSLNGLGIAEGGYVYLLGMYGISQPPALLLGLIIRGVKIVLGLPGLCFYLLKRKV